MSRARVTGVRGPAPVAVHAKRRSAGRVHGRQVTTFGLIGFTVFALGAALQGALIHAGASPDWSYAGQAAFSIELSFALNRWFTWRSRDLHLLRALAKWNTQRLGMTIPNFIGYAMFVRAGLNWLAANIAITAIFTMINYVLADLWSFRAARAAGEEPGWPPELTALTALGNDSPAYTPAPTAAADSGRREVPQQHQGPAWLPSVSVIVPCKDNADTIGATVAGILAQEYPALDEVILVGSTGDSTWTALEGNTDPRLTILEQQPLPGKRDPGVKRDKGIRKASGEVIALIDSDIVMDPDWLSRAVGLLHRQGRRGVVCGGMRSIQDTFWGRFVDRNRLGAKTPRVPAPYEVTVENFGRYKRKPPITANVVFVRDVYDTTSFDPQWAYGYEDYEWFWRVARAGHPILFSDHLDGRHHHRRSFGELVTEYLRSADGCARFVRTHPESPLARKRRRQAVLLPLAAVGVIAVAAEVAITGHALAVACAGFGVMGALMTREFRHSRRPESLTYPFVGGALGLVFTTGLVRGLTSTGSSARKHGTVVSSRRHRRYVSWPLIAILAVQAASSLSLMWTNTAFGDEGLYLWVGRLEWAHWLRGAPLPDFYGHYSGAVTVYPPIGAAADALGGLTGARIFSLVLMLTATCLLYSVASRLFNGCVALFAAAFWATTEAAIKLGAFATYDAMAVFLICLSAWLVVQAGFRKHHGELILLAAIALALGDVTAFSYAIMDPAVIALAYFALLPRTRPQKALISTAWLAGGIAVAFAIMMTALHLWVSLVNSTIQRHRGLNQGIFMVARDSWSWLGLVVIFGALGVVISRREREPRVTGLLAVLVAGALLVPLYQAHLNSGWSLDEHLAAGAWLAAIPAGYAADALFRSVIEFAPRLAAGGVCLLALVFPAVNGYDQAADEYHWWTNVTRLNSALRPLAARARGNLVISNYGDFAQEYYLPQGRDWWLLHNSLVLRPGSPSAITRQLQHGKYGLIALSFPSRDDCLLAREINESPAYHVAAVVPYATSFHRGTAVFAVWVQGAAPDPLRTASLLTDASARAGCLLRPGNDSTRAAP